MTVRGLATPIHDPHSGAPTPEAVHREDEWSIEHLAGRLVQLEGTASLTLAFKVVLDAQKRGDPVAWITSASGFFYPPDVQESGVDLAALPVVRVPDATAVFSAADLCLRSGAFGLIAADLGVPPSVPAAALARLAGLARRRLTVVLFLTRPGALPSRQARHDKPAWIETAHSSGSLGSLISLHARAERDRAGAGQFRCGLTVLKDKHRGPVWEFTEVCQGAAGLR